MSTPLVVICCSVLKKELEAVLGFAYPGTERIYIDSMLHMHPAKLHRTMEEIMSARPGSPCLVVYGDCHAYMSEIEKHHHCARTAGVNCGELLLGQEQYKIFRREKAFLFLPEWTWRWREVFQKELGFSDPILAREFMQENSHSLVYLHTGLCPIPEKTISEISTFFAMPVRITEVPLDHLRMAVQSALKRIEGINSDEL